MTVEFKGNTHFDPEKCRQFLNDEVIVFHCHHYATLFTQLADDADAFEGPKHLRDSAAESMGTVLKKYYKNNDISDEKERVAVLEQYFSFVGLGKIKALEVTPQGGKFEMPNSHIDEGWLKKWSKRGKPINFIGQGYIIGALAAIYDKDFDAYEVEETESIVRGAEKSSFTAKIK